MKILSYTQQQERLDSKLPDLFRLLLRVQKASHFQRPELFEDAKLGTSDASPLYHTFYASWLREIWLIANDSKHVRLTPAHVNSELKQETGPFHFKSLHVNIEFIESKYTVWS